MVKLTTLKNHHLEQRLFLSRLWISVTIIAILMLLLLARLAMIQIGEHQRYTTLSQKNHLTLIPIAPKRGLIYDRNGVLLAKNIAVFSLDITPSHVKNLSITINQLKEIIDISTKDVALFRKALKQHRLFQSIPLKYQLTPSEVAQFYVNRYRFPGVNVDARLMRYYPLGPKVANVLGYVGRISAQDLAHIDSDNYRADTDIGKVGIEKFYEKQLHGHTGYKQVEVDAGGHAVRTLKQIAPIPGETLTLTIDAQLQIIAGQALGKVDGAVVAIQPATGQVLALVSHPSYDPNLFVKGINYKKFKELSESSDKPLYNRALRGQYSMASTIKPFLGVVALANGIISTDYSIFDPGSFHLPHAHHVYHDWTPSGHGWVNLNKAIIVSCDTFFYRLALLMGIPQIDQTLEVFGFGHVTGIDLDGELPGLIPTPAWKFHKTGQRWYEGDTVNTGIGQGYTLATPLQLAQATATLAEHGQQFQPHLLLKVTLPNQQTLQQTPLLENAIHLDDPAAWQAIVNAMQKVITSTKPWGTGIHFGRHPPYTVAGKTGTVQFDKPEIYRNMPDALRPRKYRDDFLFIAFAPVDHPQIAVAVVVEHSHIAPSVARKVIDYYLKHNHETN